MRISESADLTIGSTISLPVQPVQWRFIGGLCVIHWLSPSVPPTALPEVLRDARMVEHS